MSSIYQVEIKQTLSRIVTIEAESIKDAIDIVDEQYERDEIVLSRKTIGVKEEVKIIGRISEKN
ncbi:DpnD/PcfM-like protein [Eubacterium uniforme]|uniref:DpnD/PcfM-like protein n=1 Tax=Eubacterium uniforme TaxID=39495 RepID=A0A1T4W863_9FIRM|nr:DpnD/PcfM family protein [Eubacterium uniforme]SKA73456.1 DpnD/PcfM-like protein [Eubacterium uniforme]